MFPDVLAEVLTGELVRVCRADTAPSSPARIHLYQLRLPAPEQLPEMHVWDAALPQPSRPGTGVASAVDAVTAALAGRRTDGAGLVPEEVDRLAGALRDTTPGLRVLAWLVSWPDSHAADGASHGLHRAEAVDFDGRLYQAARHTGSPVVTLTLDENPGNAPDLVHGVALTELLAATR